MPLDQGLLKGAQSREWVVAKPPTGATPQWVYTGRDESGLGPIYVALASISWKLNDHPCLNTFPVLIDSPFSE